MVLNYCYDPNWKHNSFHADFTFFYVQFKSVLHHSSTRSNRTKNHWFCGKVTTVLYIKHSILYICAVLLFYKYCITSSIANHLNTVHTPLGSNVCTHKKPLGIHTVRQCIRCFQLGIGPKYNPAVSQGRKSNLFYTLHLSLCMVVA